MNLQRLKKLAEKFGCCANENNTSLLQLCIKIIRRRREFQEILSPISFCFYERSKMTQRRLYVPQGLHEMSQWSNTSFHQSLDIARHDFWSYVELSYLPFC